MSTLSCCLRHGRLDTGDCQARLIELAREIVDLALQLQELGLADDTALREWRYDGQLPTRQAQGLGVLLLTLLELDELMLALLLLALEDVDLVAERLLPRLEEAGLRRDDRGCCDLHLGREIGFLA